MALLRNCRYIASPKRLQVMRKIVQSKSVRERVVEKTIKRLKAEKMVMVQEDGVGEEVTDGQTDEEKFLADFGYVTRANVYT